MSEADLIQRQRQLLRDFRQAYTEYVNSKNAAVERFKHEQAAAETTFAQMRQQADEQIGKVRDMLNEARAILIKGKWLSSTEKLDHRAARYQQNGDPADELTKYTTQAAQAFKALQSRFVRYDGSTMLARSGFQTIFISVGLALLIGPILGGIAFASIGSNNEYILLPIIIIATLASFTLLYLLFNDNRGKTPELYDALFSFVNDANYAHQRVTEQIQATYQQQHTKSQTSHDHMMTALNQLFQTKISQMHPAFINFNTRVRPRVPGWTESLWGSWLPGKELSSVSRLGELNIGNQDLGTMPGLLNLPGLSSLVFKSNVAAKPTATKAIQSLLLRLLATIPPGKLRFTFIDPVGLGQNVAPFMHLADYDEQLVTSKAWTEPQHIEQQLANLTEHMENVIQKYLRNQFVSIEDYNAQAGEVAEPYRVLVVFDFPVNFSEMAARRLVSIAQNGPRCGVYAVVLVDTDKPLPYGFKLADLEQNATVIAWDGKRFVWQDEDFKDCLLELDKPPPAALFDRILQSVGEAAKAAAKVEVPFERVAPPQAQWWSGDSRAGLSVALGPTGARKLQMLDLGKGTAQHALVAGKTGSGKSTLLHTLIVGLGLAYSPQEVELYLIDFKKGVEFKTYATYHFPHARVIAIESEREFGLSVLQGLDAELKRRGDLLRSAGADSLADYRAKLASPSAAPRSGAGGEVMPRILLLVDEFQEFFTEDDTIAAQCSQILDRLVRQGRAFGIHVLLGSQTLAGAYSLARSTIDQMAVRIALQCSEADSRLILSDDNPAARLLTRPGEAIYNAANGMVEGNNRFQIAWLPDEQRDRYLQAITTLAQKQNMHLAQIVFEGNVPAQVSPDELITRARAKPRPVNGLKRSPGWANRSPFATQSPRLSCARVAATC